MLAAILEFLGSFLGGAGDVTNTRRGVRLMILVLAVLGLLAIAWALTELL